MLPALPAPPPRATPPSFPLPSWASHLEDIVRSYVHGAESSVHHVLQWASSRTGLPIVVVAALGVVLAWRVARRTWHVIFELTLAFALLFVATRLGWIRW